MQYKFDYLFQSYKRAARRHLTACRKIIEKYDNDIPNSVRWEIYYLSGYIIEGLCIYTIYKGSDWDESVPVNQEYNRCTDRLKEMIKTFKRDTGFCFSKKHYCANEEGLYIYGHNLKKYINYLSVIYSDMPYVGNRNVVQDSKVLEMLDEWHPDIRYVMPITEQQISTNTIIRIIDVCSSLYTYIDLI